MEIKNLELDYKISIDWTLYRVLRYMLTSKYDKEFTVITHADRDKDSFRLYDYFIPNQVNTGTHTEFDDDDMIELLAEGLDMSKALGHMHSHVNMAVFASGTDFEEIVDRADLSGWNCSIVMNKRLEIFGHIVDTTRGIYIKNVPVSIDAPIDEEQMENSLMLDIKSCEDVDDVKALLKCDLLAYNLLCDPLSEKITDELDEAIETKFSSKSWGGSYYNNNNVITSVNQAYARTGAQTGGGSKNYSKKKVETNKVRLPGNLTKIEMLELQNQIFEDLPEDDTEAFKVFTDMVDKDILERFGKCRTELWNEYQRRDFQHYW
jgi:hypothetical protein